MTTLNWKGKEWAYLLPKNNWRKTSAAGKRDLFHHSGFAAIQIAGKVKSLALCIGMCEECGYWDRRCRRFHRNVVNLQVYDVMHRDALKYPPYSSGIKRRHEDRKNPLDMVEAQSKEEEV